MNTYEIVDTSDNSVVSTFRAETIRAYSQENGLVVVTGLQAKGNKTDEELTSVISLDSNRFVRLQTKEE